MPLIFTFRVDPACSGGNHFNVRVTGGPVERVVAVTLPELDAPVTDDDLMTTMRTAVKLMAQQLSSKTHAKLKAALETKAVDMTVTG